MLKIEREKFYPGLEIGAGSPALRAGTLPLSYPGQTPIHDSYPLFGFGTYNLCLITYYGDMHSQTLE